MPSISLLFLSPASSSARHLFPPLRTQKRHRFILTPSSHPSPFPHVPSFHINSKIHSFNINNNNFIEINQSKSSCSEIV
ncbi:hypothetical protein AB3S75_023192 [Citrus x aurantiifolia]